MDLHVPSHYSIPEDPPQPELHSRALQEGLALPSPKVPTFSVFSALHDSVLGEVRAAATQHGISPKAAVCELLLRIRGMEADARIGKYGTYNSMP